MASTLVVLSLLTLAAAETWNYHIFDAGSNCTRVSSAMSTDTDQTADVGSGCVTHTAQTGNGPATWSMKVPSGGCSASSRVLPFEYVGASCNGNGFERKDATYVSGRCVTVDGTDRLLTCTPVAPVVSSAVSPAPGTAAAVLVSAVVALSAAFAF
eukprot:CAMPEP_0171194532 /NCGR_PEP_ID=MMETSP0790-20130122/20937_1 /TAXON_ID=2925 /ORGANISM="Alexandrium catenella, Strain OF101" /LENGTH=154 /DNA_ID=CAMNT_0011659731 /DNA_START=101 /DNA_END=565 /DNA_ORIENTATION=+